MPEYLGSDPTEEEVAAADAVVLLTDHSVFDLNMVAEIAKVGAGYA